MKVKSESEVAQLCPTPSDPCSICCFCFLEAPTVFSGKSRQSSWGGGGPAPLPTTPPFSVRVLWSDVGEGNGTPLQYSCLEYPMDGGAW